MEEIQPIPNGTPVVAYSRKKQTKEYGVVIDSQVGLAGNGRSRSGVRLTRRQLSALSKRIVYVIEFQGREIPEEERVDSRHPTTGAKQVRP